MSSCLFYLLLKVDVCLKSIKGILYTNGWPSLCLAGYLPLLFYKFGDLAGETGVWTGTSESTGGLCISINKLNCNVLSAYGVSHGFLPMQIISPYLPAIHVGSRLCFNFV